MAVAGQGRGVQETSAILWQICTETLMEVKNLPKGDIQRQPMQNNRLSIAAGVQTLFFRTVPFSFMELLAGHYFWLIFFQEQP